MRRTLLLTLAAALLCAEAPTKRGPSKDAIGVALLLATRRDASLRPEVNVLWNMPSSGGLDAAIECVEAGVSLSLPSKGPPQAELAMEPFYAEKCGRCGAALSDDRLTEDVRVIIRRHKDPCDALLRKELLRDFRDAVNAVKAAKSDAERAKAAEGARFHQSFVKDDPAAQPLIAELDALAPPPPPPPAKPEGPKRSQRESMLSLLRNARELNLRVLPMTKAKLERCSGAMQCAEAKHDLETAEKGIADIDRQIAELEARPGP